MFSLVGWYQRLCVPDAQTIHDKAFVNSILEGRMPDSPHVKSLLLLMGQCLSAEGVDTNIKNAQDHTERIMALEQIFPKEEFEKALNGLRSEFGKSMAISTLFEDKLDGMLDFQPCNYEFILRCLNLSIMFCPPNAKCLGRKYDLRSELFYSEKNSEHCLEDIGVTLMHGCWDDRRKVLLRRRKDCLEWNRKKRRETSIGTFVLRYYRDGSVFELERKKNENIPSAIDGIQIRYNEAKGRHIITNRHLAPGTTVIVEDPFAKTLMNLNNWEIKHCFACLVKVDRCVPCPNCVRATYCSETCREKDLQNGHAYECSCIPVLQAMNMSSTFTLAFKILCKQGPNNLFNCWLDEKSIQEQSLSTKNLIAGFNPKTGTYDSDSYYQILHLMGHFDQSTISLITWFALVAVKSLDYLTPFFHEHNEQEFKMYVTSLFINHSLALVCNGVGLSEDTGREGHLDKEEFANAVYPLISLISHSCDPNVIRQSLPNGKLAIVTNRELNPGDELTFSYGYDFVLDKLSKRQSGILENYYFTCACTPCTFDWPLLEELEDNNISFLCPNCSGRYKSNQILQIQKCTLPPSGPDYIATCTNCEENVEVIQLEEQVNWIRIKMNEAENLVLVENDPVEAMPIIVESIAKYQKIISPPSKDFISAQSLLRHVFESITNA